MKSKLWFFVLVLFFLSVASRARSQEGVGLVLCGGGAKGFAHIGVLKVIDSLQIPVDYIGGTSMGAIIASLYAIGYSGKEIEKIARSTEWESLFSDDADRNLIPFYEKMMMERYLASFKVNERGVNLPEGFIRGQKILNFLGKLTIGVHDQSDFKNFRIPFFCIATDISTGKDVVLDSGYIATALRASMSIPTAFYPFELDKRLMIDGGIINNFPVDVMKQRYKGTIVGVDIQAGMMPQHKIGSITSVLNQLSTIIDLNRFNANKSLVDIYIHPDITGYSTMSFTADAVDTLIRRGQRSALDVLHQLQPFSCSSAFLAGQLSASTDTVLIVDDIKVVGQHKNSSLYIRQKLGIEPGKPFTIEYLSHGINSLYATNDYEYISYQFPHPRVLLVFCKERKVNLINVGINYVNGTNASVLVNYTHKNLLYNGDMLSIDAKLAEFPGFKLSYILDKGAILAPQVKLQYNNLAFNFYKNGNRKGNSKLVFGLFETGVNATGFNLFTVGLTSCVEFYDYYDVVYASDFVPTLPGSVTKLFYNYKLYAMYDSRNSSVLHTRGSRFYAGVKLITDNFVTYKKTVPLVTAMIKNEAAVKVSNKFTFLHGQASRVFLTSAMPHTLLLTFTGGDYKPDFYEYSLPFYGLRFLEVISKNSLVLMSGLRYQIYKRHYLTLYTNLAAVNNALVAVSSFKLIAGTGLGYTYNSFLGPMQYTLSYSNASKTLIAYVSLGFKF